MMFRTTFSLVFTVTTLLFLCSLPEASAFWRLPCHSPVVIERADPIVNPNAVSGHLHTIMGGNGFDTTMDYSKARASTCSSCTVKQDLSNYWVPSLLYAAKNGTFHPVQQNGGALIYYLQRRSNDAEKLLAFPEGFRMVTGDPMLRSFSSTLEQKAVSYACIDFTGGGGPETNALPMKNCPNGIRLQVFFPSCWNGKDLDSPDHKSHMAYPDGVSGGKCPPTHPKRFISIFYEVLYNSNDFKDQWYGGKQPFVLSSGDPTGYGLHGDFINGWDVKVLQKAVDECNSASGVVEECQHFSFFPDQVTGDCFVPPRIDEQTEGWMDKLPGCNPIQEGPGRAVVKSGCGATTVVGSPKTYFTDVSKKGWRYSGCVMDDLNARTFPIRTGADNMTIEQCIDYCVVKKTSYAGLEYGNECYCGSSPPAADRSVPAKCMMPCAGNATQICGDGLRLSVYTKDGSVAAPPASSSVKAVTRIVDPATTPTTSPTKVIVTAITSTPSLAPAGWISKGCWVDPVNPRALKTVGYWMQKITTSGCINYCSSNGFKYAGSEFGGQCFCSATLNGGKSAPDSECNIPCEGDANETCGGAARLSLFEKTSTKKRSDPTRRAFRHHLGHI